MEEVKLQLRVRREDDFGDPDPLSFVSNRKKLLFARREAGPHRWLQDQFEMLNDFVVVATDSCDGAIRAATSEYFDAMLIDLHLPGIGGYELCRLLRQEGPTAPLLLLSDTRCETDAILGLEAGASDYLAKPFGFGVLLARLRVRLREREWSENAVFEIGPYWFRPASRLLIHRRSRARIQLTLKETQILKCLCRSGGRPVPRAKLLREVWNIERDNIRTHSAETHIYRLRLKIERHPQSPEILLTEEGAYRLAIGDTDSIDIRFGGEGAPLDRAS